MDRLSIKKKTEFCVANSGATGSKSVPGAGAGCFRYMDADSPSTMDVEGFIARLVPEFDSKP